LQPGDAQKGLFGQTLSRPLSEFANKRLQLLLVSLRRPDTRHNAVPLGLDGVDDAPGHEQIHSTRLTDEPRQDQRHTLPREDGFAGANITDQGIGARDPEITRQSDHPSGAVTAAIEGRHHGFWYGSIMGQVIALRRRGRLSVTVATPPRR
jgi:hypothetical protein